MNLGAIALINEVNHCYVVSISDEVNVRGTTGGHLHVHYSRTQINPFDDLMQLEVPYQQSVTLSNEADVAGQVVVQEESFGVVVRSDFILDERALRHSIVVVQRVHSLGLSKAVINIFLDVKAVHENELGWGGLVEQLLLEAVAVLAIVDHDLAVGARHKPLIIWFQEGDVVARDWNVERDQVLDRD